MGRHRQDGAPDDRQLLNQAARGDDQAIRMLYQRHHRFVYGYTRQLLRDPQQIEEVVQDVFVALFRKPDAFEGASSLSTYLCAIARRKAVDVERSRGRSPDTVPIDEELADRVPDDSDTADVLRNVSRQQWLVSIERCMGELPLVQREALFWTYFEDERDHEVAQRQQVSQGTVKSRLNAARQSMKKCLQKLDVRGLHA